MLLAANDDTLRRHCRWQHARFPRLYPHRRRWIIMLSALHFLFHSAHAVRPALVEAENEAAGPLLALRNAQSGNRASERRSSPVVVAASFIESSCKACKKTMDCSGGEFCQQQDSGRLLSVVGDETCKEDAGTCFCMKKSETKAKGGGECCAECVCDTVCKDGAHEESPKKAVQSPAKAAKAPEQNHTEVHGQEDGVREDNPEGAVQSRANTPEKNHTEEHGREEEEDGALNGSTQSAEQSHIKMSEHSQDEVQSNQDSHQAESDEEHSVGAPNATEVVCDHDTGATCQIFDCYVSRMAQCVSGMCICKDACAVKGRCIPKANYFAAGGKGSITDKEIQLLTPGSAATMASEQVDLVVIFFYILAPALQVATMGVIICLGELKRADRANSDPEAKIKDLVDGEREDEMAQAMLDYVPEGPQKIVTLAGGLGQRFSNLALEDAYAETACRRGMILGAQLLVIAALLGSADRFVVWMRDVKACRQPGAHYQLPEIAVLSLMGLLAMTTTQLPKGGLYTVLVVFWFIYVIFRAIPPLKLSCDQLEALPECHIGEDDFMREMRENDCSLLGHTAQQAIISWLLLTPWIIPFLVMMHSVWVFILVAYPIFLYSDSLHEHHHQPNEYFVSTAVLSVALILSTLKKFNVEKAQRLGFIADLEQKKASYTMYKIFEYMVPVHVIPRMLHSPGEPIAEPIERVSILFVMICDFDQYAKDLAPAALLEFLNDAFGRMDTICAKHRVTKVETVGEEYVACVGALPQDAQENLESGHGKILARLLKASSEMLDLQKATIKDKNVKLQMGIHSGPIVAGVIGLKLPRYRLFGDTINTAARFMQKGVEGRLQLSEDTYEDASPLGIEVEPRGEVEMKGKGTVNPLLLTGLGPALAALDTSSPDQARGEGGDNEPAKAESKRKGPSKGIFKMLDAGSGEVDESDLQGYDESFEEVLRQMEVEELKQAEETSRKGVMKKLPGYNAMTPEMEASWFKWFHRTKICTDLLYRLDKQAFAIAALTLCETWYLVRTKAWMHDHQIFPGWLRIPIFETVRTAAFFTLIFWRMAAHSTKLVFRYPLAMQVGLVLSNCLIAVFLYVSYDVMVITTHQDVADGIDDSEQANFRMDQMLALVFVLEFNALTTWDTTLFSTSWAYVFVALMLMLCSFSKWGQLYFHAVGRILFVCNSIMTSYIAYEVEQSSRSRFKARHAVQLTENRVGGILKTLMPPQLIEELKSLPPDAPNPSHTYMRCTIAQSDLCGFTQLSAKRTPREVVGFVSDLFGRFDALCAEFGIYKVETIGDAYIAAMAEHTLTYKNSPISVIRFGFAMIEACRAWSEGLGEDVTCRVGVHFGGCTGGIVGTGMQRYHLFGELMNVIEIMESCGVKAAVHVSPACKGAVEHDPSGLWPEGGGFSFRERQEEYLTTSKDKRHEFDEVGGRTFLAIKEPSYDSIKMRE